MTQRIFVVRKGEVFMFENILARFENDEIVLINRTIAKESIDSFTLDKMKKSLSFQKLMISNNDETESEIVELVDSTLRKITKLTETEWNILKENTPLPCLDEDFSDDVY